MELSIPVECGECGAELSTTTREIARGVTKVCPQGHRTTFRDDGGGAKAAQKSMDSLDAALKRFGR